MELGTDPRPDLLPDSHRWVKLFRLIPLLADSKRAAYLYRNLWRMRVMGTVMRQGRDGIRFYPLTAPDGYWESEQDFEDIKSKIFKPYAAEVTGLLKEIELG